MAAAQDREALEIQQAELRLAEIRAELRLNELKLKRDARLTEREVSPDELASDGGASHEAVAGSGIPIEPRVLQSGREAVPNQEHQTPISSVQLFRTESAAFDDELYIQGDSYSSVSSKRPISNPRLPANSSIIAQRLQTASLARSTSASGLRRERSPFEDNSPMTSDWAVSAAWPVTTTAIIRQQQSDSAAAVELGKHHAPLVGGPPRTISPKDALLDYTHDPHQTPLFQDSAPAGYENRFNTAVKSRLSSVGSQQTRDIGGAISGESEHASTAPDSLPLSPCRSTRKALQTDQRVMGSTTSHNYPEMAFESPTSVPTASVRPPESSSSASSSSNIPRGEALPSRECLPNARVTALELSSKVRNRTTMKVPRKMKRKAEDSIPGDHRICFQLEKMPSVPTHANSSKKTRKRKPAACSECRRKHLQCSHDLRRLPAAHQRLSDFDIFAVPFTFEIERVTEGQQLEDLIYSATTFPLVDGDLRLIHEQSGLEWHLSILGVAKKSAGNSGSALLRTLDALSDPGHLDAIIRASMCTKYIEALDWIVWLCTCVQDNPNPTSDADISRHSSLSKALMSLRGHVLDTLGKHPLGTHRTSGGLSASSDVLPDTCLFLVALWVGNCAQLDRIAEAYFHSRAQTESGEASDVVRWWHEIWRPMGYDVSVFPGAIRDLSDPYTQSGVWQMALEGVSMHGDLELCRDLLHNGRSWAGEDTDRGNAFAALLRQDPCPTRARSIPKATSYGETDLTSAAAWRMDRWRVRRCLGELLVTASLEGEHEIANDILSFGTEYDLVTYTRGLGRLSPLRAASTPGYEILVRHFLQLGASPNALPGEEESPLIAAARLGHSSIASILIDASADVNARCASGPETAIFHACECGHDDVADILLDAGADLLAEVVNQETSLYAAAVNGHADIVDRLLAASAEVPGYHHTALLEAVKDGSETTFELLLAKGAVLSDTESTKEWDSIIATAALGGRVGMVELLLVTFEGGLYESPCPEDGLSRSLLRESGALRQWIQNEAQMDLPEDLRQTRDKLRALQLLLEHGIWVDGYSTMKEEILNSIAHLEILNEMDLHLARWSAKDVQSQSFPWTAEDVVEIPRRLYEDTSGPTSPDSYTSGSVDASLKVVPQLPRSSQNDSELAPITSSEQHVPQWSPAKLYPERHGALGITPQASLPASRTMLEISPPMMPKQLMPAESEPDVNVFYASLKSLDFDKLDRLAAQYFRWTVDSRSDLRLWWQQLLGLISETQLLTMIRGLPNSHEKSQVWEMAFHGAFVLANFGMSRSLLQCDIPGSTHQAWHSSHFVPLLSNRPDESTPSSDLSTDSCTGSDGHTVAVWQMDARLRKRMLQDLLVTASLKAEYAVAECLLRAGLDPNCTIWTEDGRCSPLQAAARSGSDALVDVLLQAGAHHDLQPDEDECSLHIASRLGHGSIVKLILDTGVSFKARNECCQTALHLAADQGYCEIMSLSKLAETVRDSEKRVAVQREMAMGC